ncbi:hypothetical protein Trydic_g6187 [Trypoxylus dichotomus]
MVFNDHRALLNIQPQCGSLAPFHQYVQFALEFDNITHAASLPPASTSSKSTFAGLPSRCELVGYDRAAACQPRIHLYAERITPGREEDEKTLAPNRPMLPPEIRVTERRGLQWYSAFGIRITPSRKTGSRASPLYT